MKKRAPKKAYGGKITHSFFDFKKTKNFTHGIATLFNIRWIYPVANNKYNPLRCGYCSNYNECLGKKLTTFDTHYCSKSKNEFKHRLVCNKL